ncbi:MAG: response regulator transcription factor [Chloroflexi bacterium]|nr:response regulator transcription factor [Chloroflexota bacterium]
MPQRILVVDDDPQIVRLLRAYLEKEGFQVFVAYDGNMALHIIRSERPDLVLLDLMLPNRDGWEVTRVVRSDVNLVAIPIIMLTARVEDGDKILGLELGADDYITKPFNPREVVARVRAVLRRVHGEPVLPKVIQTGPLRIDVDRHEVEVNGQPVRLTPTEFSLLRTLAEHPGYALTRLELIEKGLGYSYEGLDRTVDSHIKNLRRKLDQAGSPGLGAELIETVFGVGYRLRSEPRQMKEGRS